MPGHCCGCGTHPPTGVHSPYSEPPEWEQIPNGTGFWDQTFGSMLQVVDRGINNITTALKAADRWDDALIMISSDNGGIGPGNNYPLRCDGMACMAFLSLDTVSFVVDIFGKR